MELNEGELLLSIGPSGSGKTTLLSLFGCLINPTEGKVQKVSQQKYLLGSLLYSDFLEIEKSLSDADNNMLNNTYDLLIAKLRWQRATGGIITKG